MSKLSIEMHYMLTGWYEISYHVIPSVEWESIDKSSLATSMLWEKPDIGTDCFPLIQFVYFDTNTSKLFWYKSKQHDALWRQP